MRGSSDIGRGGVRGTGERSSLRPSFRETGANAPHDIERGGEGAPRRRCGA